MSDVGTPPAPVPEQPPVLPPVPPPKRSGCLTAFMIVAGIILLLPGVCSLIFGFSTFMSSPEPVITALVVLGLLVATGGVVLIWAAIRGSRH